MTPLRVSISVGHTESHPGAIHAGTNLKEYDVSLRYRHGLLALLEHDRRFDVYQVMPNLGIDARVQAVNSGHQIKPLDLAIDLHMNANANPVPNYSEVYHFCYPDGTSSSRGRIYGDAFLDPLVDEMKIGDGKRDGLSEPFGDEEWERERWTFVRGCASPALVIEPAFISNDHAVDQIIQHGMVSTMAMGCYRGLVACLEV